MECITNISPIYFRDAVDSSFEVERATVNGGQSTPGLGKLPHLDSKASKAYNKLNLNFIKLKICIMYAPYEETTNRLYIKRTVKK
jgi:N-formylglutamate amidohydrolase